MMKTAQAIFASIMITFFCLSVAFAFDRHGQVTPEIDYEDMEIHPPKVNCDEPIVKGDPNETECLAKVSAKLTYAFTDDREFKATLLFYNIFDEIIGEAEINEILRWEEDHVDIVDFVYIYPEFDFSDLKNSHHIQWEGHEQLNDEPTDK